MTLKHHHSSSRSTATTAISQAIALLATKVQGRDQLILKLLHSTGLTPGELVSLRVKDLSSATHELRIPAEITKHKQARNIVLSPTLSKQLQSSIRTKSSSECIFSTRQSPQLSTRRIEQIVKDACNKAKLSTTITPRDIRNHFLHIAAQQAESDEELKETTGLKSITKKTVLDLSELGRLRAVAKKTSLRDKMLVELLLETSIKPSEAVRIKRQDIKDDSLTLQSRSIPIPNSLSFKLQQLASQDKEFIFSTRQGPQLSVRRVEQIIARLGVQAKLELTSHSLRATAIKRIAQKFGEAEAQRRAGLKTTLAYTHGIVRPANNGGGAL